MQPVVAGGRLGPERCELRPDESGFSEGFAPSTVLARNLVWVRFANYATHKNPPRPEGATTGSILRISHDLLA